MARAGGFGELDGCWWRWSVTVGLRCLMGQRVTLGWSRWGCPSSALQRVHGQAGPG